MIRFIEMFDQKQEKMNVDATAYALIKLEASIQYLMEYKAKDAKMNDTDFEL
jgi:hypothetical protein